MAEVQWNSMGPALASSPEFKMLSEAVGGAGPAINYLYATGMVESGMRNVDNGNAQGLWQVLKSTQRLFKKAYPSLPPFTKADALVQARYACAIIYDSVQTAKSKGIPPLVAKAYPNVKERWPMSVRFYYHNGPYRNVRPGIKNLEEHLLIGMKSFHKHFFY